MQALLYLVFILSGAAGLIYESIWSRYLGLFVGHSAYAQIIVLAIFLGGMSLGAILAARRSERVAQPLLWYAIVELIVGIIGFVFHYIYSGVTSLAYDAIFPALAGGATLTVVKWLIAALLILPQSVLLGATFPLMSAGVLRLTPSRPGRVLALLYFANSIGAAVGVLFAGFVLVGWVGLPGTLRTAAALNVIVALLVFAAVRWREEEGRETGDSRFEIRDSQAELDLVGSHPSLESRISNLDARRLLLIVAFGTAVASFIYEIAWIRMLSLVLGSATHSFELMLSAFILGLALGALWAHRKADQLSDPIKTLGVVQWVMGFAAMATLPFYLRSFEWTAWLMRAVDESTAGYTIFNLVRYAFCLVVMFPATFCAGITLPLITRTLISSGAGEKAIGLVYGVNTLGSIVGVVLAGLVFMPLLGLKLLLIQGAIIDMALGVVLLRVAAGSSKRERRFALAAGLAVVVLVEIAVWGNDFNKAVLTSGVFRYGRVSSPDTKDVIYYKDGRTATVSVSRMRGKSLVIATNGKPDASLDSAWQQPTPGAAPRTLGGDLPTQVLLPLMTLAHAPHARTAAVIGHGSGMSSHFLLGSPVVRNLVTIEIEPGMIEGSRHFYPANARVFEDRRSRFVIDDAKSFFASERRKYDLILSEPSNPWVSGVSGLFTTEFYDRVRGYLSPEGVFGQWLHLYEINDQLVLTVLAALHKSFPSYEIFLTSSGDMLIVASTRPELRDPDWSVFQLPMVARDLQPVITFTPRMLEATRILSREALAPLLDTWRELNSDYVPLLDLSGERTRFMRSSADGFRALGDDRFDIVGPFTGRRSEFIDDTRVPVPQIPRMRNLALGALMRSHFRYVMAQDMDSTSSVAVQRRWLYESAMQSGKTPPDWRVWLNTVLQVDADIHGGTSGVADEIFFYDARQFAERYNAPMEVLSALAFVRALSVWDWVAASAAADRLMPSAQLGKSWLPIDLLREGAIVAKLRTGDAAGAKRVFTSLVNYSGREDGDLRIELLWAYIWNLEHGRKLPGPVDTVSAPLATR
ncbi:MAG TPA: fused MFS/spermidine synthase [Gemmatimonadaceae bacterium]|nr:fused MFS/spermidine synthase [Gemmatimonadaceae bacterium]